MKPALQNRVAPPHFPFLRYASYDNKTPNANDRRIKRALLEERAAKLKADIQELIDFQFCVGRVAKKTQISGIRLYAWLPVAIRRLLSCGTIRSTDNGFSIVINLLEILDWVSEVLRNILNSRPRVNVLSRVADVELMKLSISAENDQDILQEELDDVTTELEDLGAEVDDG
ncbi:hypothetical protein BD410DRAFT_269682 [Rickenella mellea]|uniref:Uncharacterized protein n=1 Tax=Rickenella mellea TaxID=50990 RepID=A0A4Y7Q5I7_9AGAM|nr:hypothetical protein BD410DRAFT_269682 [Rickenella mellea]